MPSTTSTRVSFSTKRNPLVWVDYFLSCLRADIEDLRTAAGIHPNIYRDYHRSLSKVFPCGIFYTISGQEIVIWAVVDLRRNPQWVAERLGLE